MNSRTGMHETIKIKVMKAMDSSKKLIVPFGIRNSVNVAKPSVRSSFMVPNQTVRLSSVSHTKRINSLTKKSKASIFRTNSRSKPIFENTSLLDVRIEPIKSKMTKNWESSSSSESKSDTESLLPIPKVTTIEEFYQKRKSRLDPFSILFTQKRASTRRKSNISSKFGDKSVVLKTPQVMSQDRLSINMPSKLKNIKL